MREILKEGTQVGFYVGSGCFIGYIHTFIYIYILYSCACDVRETHRCVLVQLCSMDVRGKSNPCWDIPVVPGYRTRQQVIVEPQIEGNHHNSCGFCRGAGIGLNDSTNKGFSRPRATNEVVIQYTWEWEMRNIKTPVSQLSYVHSLG